MTDLSSAPGPAKRDDMPTAVSPTSGDATKRATPLLRVATYNIHSCVDTSNHVAMEKTARVIDGLNADVIALQEVDAGRRRTGGRHQARWLGRRLAMDWLFYPVIHRVDEQYGLAVLSRVPMEAVRFARLPTPRMIRPREVRGVMWVRLQTPAAAVDLVNTHLGLQRRERRLQIEALMGEDWLGRMPKNGPQILCGDFNAGPRSYVYRRIRSRLIDVQQNRSGFGTARATFFSYCPILRLDHIFVSPRFSILRAGVSTAPPARSASDHLPVRAELHWPEGRM